VEPNSSNPYQPPKDSGPPLEKPPAGPGGLAPITGAIIILAIGGYTAPSFKLGGLALTCAVAGTALASNRGQRFVGVVLVGMSLLAIARAWQH
jgi:hypothetical protein